MTSPGARQRRRREQYQAPRTRQELVIAVGAGAAIVLGTALMIWLLRPGGLADRQPRSSWLVAFALAAAVIAAVVILRPKNRREMNRPVWLAGSFGIILVAAIVAGIFWPSGLLRHTPKLATIPTTPTATAPPSTLAGATTSGATATTGNTPTTAASATTQPTTATTTATSTAPSSSSP